MRHAEHSNLQHGTLRAFTLVELLVVIAIITLLSSVVITSLSTARTKARDAQRIKQARQITVALEAYGAEQGDQIFTDTGNGPASKIASGKATSVLSYLKNAQLFNQATIKDTLYDLDNYYVGFCPDGKYNIYLKVEREDNQHNRNSIEAACDGVAAYAANFRHLVGSGRESASVATSTPVTYTAVDTSFLSGSFYNTVMPDSLGRPMFTYSVGGTAFWLARCTDTSCNSTAQTNLGTGAGLTQSEALNAGPLFAYMNGTNVVGYYCSDFNCNSGASNLSAVASRGFSVIRNNSGFATYLNSRSNNTVQVIQCTNATCTGATANTPYSQTTTDSNTAATRLSTGFLYGVTQEYDGTNYHLHTLECTNNDCSTSNHGNRVVTGYKIYSGRAVAIRSNGLPAIIASRESDSQLTMILCTNMSCSTYTTSVIAAYGIRAGFTFPRQEPLTVVYDNGNSASSFNGVAQCTTTACGAFTSGTVGSSTKPLWIPSAFTTGGVTTVVSSNQTTGIISVSKCTNSTCN